MPALLTGSNVGCSVCGATPVATPANERALTMTLGVEPVVSTVKYWIKKLVFVLTVVHMPGGPDGPVDSMFETNMPWPPVAWQLVQLSPSSVFMLPHAFVMSAACQFASVMHADHWLSSAAVADGDGLPPRSVTSAASQAVIA